MTANPSETSRWSARARHTLRLLAVVAGAGALAWYSNRVPVNIDVSRMRTHTLSAASLRVLETLPAPIAVTAYLTPNHVLREQAKHLFARYRRHRADISIGYVDPAGDPERVRAEEIRVGEMIIESDGRRERTTEYSEQAVTEALARLSRRSDRWVVFVTGHGERSPRRGANYDVSAWATVLEKRGFKVQEVNLAESRAVPDNTAVLVIASPQVDFQMAETAAVTDYLETGGNLLWLTEPDAPPGFKDLAHAVGFERIPGTIVDPITLARGVDNPAFVLITRYARHAATAGFNYTTVMFYAAAVHARARPGWQATRLIYSGEKAWSETEVLEGNVEYDDGVDYMGPLPLALALSRRLAGTEQRIVVVGDGDFLANTYLQNSGNQDLGVRFVEWLARDDAMIAVPSRAAEDNSLALQDWHKAVIGFTFLVGLPGAFALNGLLIWWRRRRA